MSTWTRRLSVTAATLAAAVGLGGCGFSPYDIPLPGGADTGDDPYTVTAQFRDVLDLVPQSGVRVNDLPVGKVTDIELDGWNAKVTLQINRDAKLPDNAVATIRQTSLLGEKFVSLSPPATGATGRLGDGDTIPLDRSGRNPEIEEVLSAASLLFNGGGIERTNTIVRELNQTLGGNEPEIKELLDSTTTFLGQLDDNKEQILTSLEQVNRLAVATNDQRGAITGALDDLPEALRVVNGQRDDLVKLLQSLDRLGDVATGVIQQSKADTVADLKLLVPTLTNLSKSADDFAYDFQALLSYPFTDGAVGSGAQADGSPRAGSDLPALGRCENPAGNSDNDGFCVGDFANLSLRLDLDVDQLQGLLQVLGIDLSTLGGGAGEDDDAAAGDQAGLPEVPELAELQKVLSGLRLPGLGGASQQQDASGATPSPESTATTSPLGGLGSGGSGGGLLCGLFGSCRAAPASVTSGSADLASVLLQPAVAP
jgi:phospholipid/cholesterol/gamma-HCH transport system substrate-binding protein